VRYKMFSFLPSKIYVILFGIFCLFCIDFSYDHHDLSIVYNVENFVGSGSGS